MSWSEVLDCLRQRIDLSGEQTHFALELMVTGQCREEDVEDFLLALRAKGETIEEIAAAAGVLRRHMVAWDAGCDVLDTCGTGGDQSGTFNISTAVAIVAAGAG